MCPTDMEGTYAEYTEWAEEGVPQMVSQNYKKTLKQMEIIKPYEETLVSSHIFIFTHSLSQCKVLIDSL